MNKNLKQTWKPTGIPLTGVLVAACILTAPLAAADPIPPLPPQDFHGAYDAATNTARLTWLPPDTAHSYHYVLYRGTTLLGDVDGLSFNDTSPSSLTNLYTIQAVRPGDGPGRSNTDVYSTPIITLVGTICSPILVSTYSGPPWVAWGINPECIP